MIRIVEPPEFDEHTGLCGVETNSGSCPEVGTARVQIATFEYDHTEWAPYVGSDVRVLVCRKHKASIEADYERARAAEAEQKAKRERADERVRELREQLAAAERERDQI